MADWIHYYPIQTIKFTSKKNKAMSTYQKYVSAFQKIGVHEDSLASKD